MADLERVQKEALKLKLLGKDAETIQVTLDEYKLLTQCMGEQPVLRYFQDNYWLSANYVLAALAAYHASLKKRLLE